MSVLKNVVLVKNETATVHVNILVRIIKNVSTTIVLPNVVLVKNEMPAAYVKAFARADKRVKRVYADVRLCCQSGMRGCVIGVQQALRNAERIAVVPLMKRVVKVRAMTLRYAQIPRRAVLITARVPVFAL